ncbi:hypothetical protein BGZ95_004848, partial [Linnemannia exigua]
EDIEAVWSRNPSSESRLKFHARRYSQLGFTTPLFRLDARINAYVSDRVVAPLDQSGHSGLQGRGYLQEAL